MPLDLVPFGALVAVFLILWAVLYALLPAAWRLLAGVAKWTARLSLRSTRIAHWHARTSFGISPFEAYLPVAVIVMVGVVGVGWFGEELLDLTELVRDKSPMLQSIDDGVHDWAIARRSAPLTTSFAP